MSVPNWSRLSLKVTKYYRQESCNNLTPCSVITTGNAARSGTELLTGSDVSPYRFFLYY